MAQPPQYTIGNDFSQDESNQTSGRSTVDTSAIDAELNNIQTSLNAAIANLGVLQRDDGQLRDQFVQIYNLAQDVIVAFESDINPRGNWATATAYAIKDFVNVAGLSYLAVVAHTSAAAFATDLAAGKWMLFAAPVEALLDQAIARDGSNTPTNDLPMGGFTHIGAGSPLTLDSYTRVRDVSGQSPSWAGPFGGTNNAIVIDTAILPDAYVYGARFAGVVTATNSGPVTVQITGLGSPKALTKFGLSPLESGDLTINSVASMTFDGVRFQLDSATRSAVQLISSGTLVNQTGINFINLTSTFRKYVLEFSNLRVSATLNRVIMRTSTDNGSNFASDTNYSHYGYTSDVSNGLVANETVGSVSILISGSGFSVEPNVPLVGKVEIFDPTDVGTATRVYSQSDNIGAAGLFRRIEHSVGIRNIGEVNNAVRFLTSTGQFTAMTYRFYGYR